MEKLSQAHPRRTLMHMMSGGRTGAALRTGVLIAIISVADWRAASEIPLGFLYLLPMALASQLFGLLPIAAIAALCTWLTELFDEFTWSARTGIPRDILYFAAFFGIGLFLHQIRLRRLREQDHWHEIQRQERARREAEEQLEILVESSPAAVFTASSSGTVLLANDAAHRLFGAPTGSLQGKSIHRYLPSLVNVPAPDAAHPSFRTVMQSRGRREDGDVFLADIWFSTYTTSHGSRLAAMVVDASEDLRAREESSLHQLLSASRILVGAVSHEIRNVCGAIALVHQNLARKGNFALDKDFEALGDLVLALKKIAAMELRQTAQQACEVDLAALFDELRIIVEPALRDDEIAVRWTIDPYLPSVWADRQSLIQVFLNLFNNSSRALRNRDRRELHIATEQQGRTVLITVSDTGGGIEHPERLFRPFQQQAQSSGLGLYLSRALMRSFRGDLRYQPSPGGSSFIIELAQSTGDLHDDDNSNSAGR